MNLTELESAVLGVVWRRGPCTAYTIQANFDLVSASWRASPGSLYPLLKKLHARGLLLRRDQKRGARMKSTYSLSVGGRRVLREWVGSVPEWIGRPPADPIRTRTFFMDVLESDTRRLEFLRDAEAATRSSLRRLEAGVQSLATGEQELERLAQTGAILQLRARLTWIVAAARFVRRSAR